MVSQGFISSLQRHIRKRLKDKMSGPPRIWTSGSDRDQAKPVTAMGLVNRWVFDKTEKYQAKEFVAARLPMGHPVLRSVDMVIPVINIRNSSIPGVAVFGACIPYSIPETYVLRSSGFKGLKLFPYDWVVEQGYNPKEIIENDWIEYEPIKRVNMDKKLCKKLRGNTFCIVSAGLTEYNFHIPVGSSGFNPPMGTFFLVPYKGYTFIVTLDAGVTTRVHGNSPYYPLNTRINAMATVAKYIARWPEYGDEVGVMQFDLKTALLLSSFIKGIDGDAAPSTNVGTNYDTGGWGGDAYGDDEYYEEDEIENGEWDEDESQEAYLGEGEEVW